MAKKGQIHFSALLALIVVPIILGSAIYAMSSMVREINLPLGRDASAIMVAEHTTISARSYLHQSAKLAAEQAAYELSHKGGGSQCGAIMNPRSNQFYSYWSEACFPQDYEDNFILLYGSYLDDYLRNFPDIGFPLDNYNFHLSGSKVIGVARNPLMTFISGQKHSNIGYYSKKPSFSIDYNYDMKKIFDELKFYALLSEIDTSKSIVKSVLGCAEDDQKLLGICVSKAVADLKDNLPYSIIYDQIDETTFSFDIETKGNVIAYSEEDKEIKKRDITVRFAIDFSRVDDAKPEMLGEPVEFMPFEIESKSIDPDCPAIDVEDIPDYINCEAEYYCKLSPAAINLIIDAEKKAIELHSYRLNISEAYRTYDQQGILFGHGKGNRPDCQNPNVQGKSVSVKFLGVDMGESPVDNFNHHERKKLLRVMKETGWVSDPRDFRRYECCGTSLYLKNKFAGIDFRDFNHIPFEFVNEDDRPGDEDMEGIVNLLDVWKIAKKENVNYYLLISVIGAESSFVDTNEPYDKKAHGVMQMFLSATKQVFSDLQSNYPGLKEQSPSYVREHVFTSKDQESVKIQVHAGTLYLKWIKSYLEKKGIDAKVPVVIQAYHDGIGYIQIDGSSNLCDIKSAAMCDEAVKYVPKVAQRYNKFAMA